MCDVAIFIADDSGQTSLKWLKEDTGRIQHGIYFKTVNSRLDDSYVYVINLILETRFVFGLMLLGHHATKTGVNDHKTQAIERREIHVSVTVWVCVSRSCVFISVYSSACMCSYAFMRVCVCVLAIVVHGDVPPWLYMHVFFAVGFPKERAFGTLVPTWIPPKNTVQYEISEISA